MNRTLLAALSLAAKGWCVFPVRRDKAPYTPKGHTDATTDFAQIGAWWREWPDANLAVNCEASGLVVVDVDGSEGEDTLKGHYSLPDTLESKTGRGRHLFYSYVGEDKFPGTLGPKVDVKHAGFIILPPSAHANGNVYQWANALPIAPLPEWFPRRDDWSSPVRAPSPTSLLNDEPKRATPQDWAGILEPAGWTWNGRDRYWSHPQSTEHKTARLTPDGNLWIYGTTSYPFETHASYSPFMAWGLLNPGATENPWSRIDATRLDSTLSTGDVGGLPTGGNSNGHSPEIDDTPRGFVAWDDLKTTRPATWLIPDYLPEGAFGQITGPSGVGKSFVVLDMAARLSQEGKRVLYAVGEGQARFPSRVAAWEKRHGSAGVAFSMEPLNVFDFREIERVRVHGPWDLIIIDTLARHMFGRTEDTSGMTAFVEACQRLQRASGGTVLVVHHFGWSQPGMTGRQRGSSVLYSACDAVLYVTEYGPGLRVEVEKMKDGIEGIHQDYVLADEGDSCVLVPMGELPPDLVEIDGVTYERNPVTKGLRTVRG